MDFGGSAGAEREDKKKTESQDTTTSGIRTQQTELDQKAIEKIISDVLGSESGLAGIFGGEQGIGVYNSTAAAQASGDLVTNLVGELAKLTSKTTTTDDEEVNVDARTDERNYKYETEVHGGISI